MCKGIVLMIGIPGSGKTTAASKIMNKELDSYISRDQIRYSMLSFEDDYFSKETLVFNKFIKEINEAILNTERWVFIDATHINQKSRAKILNKLENVNAAAACYINVPLETALERNNQRQGRAKVPQSAIKDMYKNFTPPTKEEGFCAIFEVDEKGKIRRIV